MSAESPSFDIPQSLSHLENKTLNRRQLLMLGVAGAGVAIGVVGERIGDDSQSDMHSLQTEKDSMVIQSPSHQGVFDLKKEELQSKIDSEQNQEAWSKGITWLGIGVAAGGAIALKADILNNFLRGSRPSSPSESPQQDQTS